MPEPPRSALRLGFALLAFTALALAVFRPVPAELRGTLPAAGGSSADALLLTWAMDHVSRTLLANPRALFDAGIFHPLRNALALGDHMIGEALLGLPVRLAGGSPLLAYNLLSLASYVAGATAMFAYTRAVVGGGVVPALIGGIVFAFTPYRFASPLWLQVLWTAFVPLSLLAWLRFVATRRTAAWVAWVACWIAQALMGQYVALYFTVVMGVLGGFALLAAPGRRDRRLWLGTLLAPLVVGLVLWPTVAPYLDLRATQGTIRSGGLDTPLAFLWPAPGTLLGWALPRHAAVALGPGVVAWALALAGLLLGRHGPVPRLALPRRFVWGVHVVGLCASLALVLAPLRWQHLLPGLDMARNSNRAFFVGLCFVAALAASGTRWLNARRLRGRLAGFALVVLALADMGRPPRERQPFPTAATLSPGVRRLVELPAGSVVYERADLPDPVALAMYHQIFHRHPMPIGYSGFVPPGGDFVTQRLATFPSPGAARLLRRLGVGWVLVRVPPATADDVIARATALGARLDTRDGSELVFDVRDLPPPPDLPPTATATPAPVQLGSSGGDAGLDRLVDGDLATVWAGRPVAGIAPWLLVDLGPVTPVAGLELTAPLDRAPTAFRTEVAVSLDGTEWRQLDAVFDPVDLDGLLAAPPAHPTFVARWPAVPARFLRLTNPFVAFWQEQLRLLAAKSKELGLSVKLGWHGEWVLDELRVLTEPGAVPAPQESAATAIGGASDRAPSR